MGYSIDLKQIQVQKYLKILKSQNLLPGRRLLLEDIDLKFHKIMDLGISNLYELKNSLSSPQKISTFSSKTKIAEDYLVILKREMGSLEQKPVLISDFPGISKETIKNLSEINIKTSKDFYTLFGSSEGIREMSAKSDIAENEAAELLCLCDLVRINGVGAVAARTMYEGGYKSISDIVHADAGELLAGISAVNSIKQYYKAALGIKDMEFVIFFANLILENE